MEPPRAAYIARSAYITKRRYELWCEQHGRCHWCNVETLLPDMAGYYRSNGTNALSGRAATLDHIYSRLDPRRTQKLAGPRHVMACSTCNGRRSKEECMAFPGHERRALDTNI